MVPSASHCFPIENAGRQDFMHTISLRLVVEFIHRWGGGGRDIP